MKYKVIENVNFSTICNSFHLDIVLPIGSHIISDDTEYEIITYIKKDNDYIIIVRKLNKLYITYLDKIK